VWIATKNDNARNRPEHGGQAAHGEVVVHGEVQQDRGRRVRQPVVDVEEEAVERVLEYRPDEVAVRKQRTVLTRLGPVSAEETSESGRAGCTEKSASWEVSSSKSEIRWR
jgi:hypothetical protein